MYSLVIAEDELTTRRGLVHMVKWNEIGECGIFRRAGTVSVFKNQYARCDFDRY